MNLKKIFAIAAAVVFVGVLSLSVLAFTNSEPSGEKVGASVTGQSEHHAVAAGDTTKVKSCCEKSGEAASTECKHSGEGEANCPHHTDKTADTK